MTFRDKEIIITDSGDEQESITIKIG